MQARRRVCGGSVSLCLSLVTSNFGKRFLHQQLKLPDHCRLAAALRHEDRVVSSTPTRSDLDSLLLVHPKTPPRVLGGSRSGVSCMDSLNIKLLLQHGQSRF